MFTGIIENTGMVVNIINKGSNKTFRIRSMLAPELKVDQSLSHNGVCLTVEVVSGDEYEVTAIDETLQRSNINDWMPGSSINLERCMQINGRLDGHLVQGHVDTTAVCVSITNKDGSREFTFRISGGDPSLMIEKGSITLNGISLTIYNVTSDAFTVAVIPYTLEHTNMIDVKESSIVNIEFDMIGKYIARKLSLKL